MIEFTKQVIFRDCNGKITKIYSIGDRIPFSCKVNGYFVTAFGGIWEDEAIEV